MKKKVLFIDRDGTMIKETIDEQIDGFDKMIFYPKCISFLRKIATINSKATSATIPSSMIIMIFIF